MNLAASGAALAAAVLLAACASAPKPPADGKDFLSGRLSVRVEASETAAARAMSAAFELQGNEAAGQFDLSTPLGTVLAQARWANGRVQLATSQGTREFANLDELTREVLGEPIPVAALFDWLRGRPWPGAASVPTTPPAEPGFAQLGWNVSLARFDEAWVAALRDRAPAVTVRARLDRH